MEGNMDNSIDTGTAGAPGRTPEMQGRGSEGSLEQAKETARDRLAEVRDATTERVETQKNRAADTLSDVARSLRSSTDQLQNDDFGAGQYIRQAADQVDRLAGYLQGRDVTDMLDQAEDFARRQPAVFVGTAFAMGMIGARFLKSSRERLDRERYGDMRDRPYYERPAREFSDGSRVRSPGATPQERMGDDRTSRSRFPDYETTETSRQMGYAASPDRPESRADDATDLDPGMR